jgi:signal transduction histidine kinase
MTTHATTEREPLLVHDLHESRSWSLRRPGTIRVDHYEGTAFQHSAAIPSPSLLRFVQMMVHDFRHHLSAVYANSEFLSAQCHDLSEASDLLAEIRLAMDCITDQLESLLLFAEVGRVFCPRRQPLARVIEQAVQMARPHSDALSVSILSQIQSDVRGCVDGQRLASAIFNLILNGCQAAADGAALGRREVVIALYDDGRDAFVRVTDNGPGVPSEMRGSLFQPFMRAGKYRGMGLGLAIAKCVAEEHGGEIYLELSNPGKTVFALKLPKSGLRAQSSLQS